MMALVDANNFYVSCERLFRPQLWQRPVVVLSNNDGCIVARSNEVKRLGVPMGCPLFKVKALLEQNEVIILSSNYALYADISARITDVLLRHAPEVIPYSIDESFLDLSSLQAMHDIEQFCCDIVKKIYRYVGIPVSIGIGSTNTLAKVANKWVKMHQLPSHVLKLQHPEHIDTLLKQFSLTDIWGIGARWGQRLQQLGLQQAYDLKYANLKLIRQHFGCVLARTVQELNGIQSIQLDEVGTQKQQIRVAKSFGQKQTHLKHIQQALNTYIAIAATKLRQQHALTQGFIVFLQTSLFSKTPTKYHQAASIRLPIATADTRQLIAAAKPQLAALFRPGLQYKKVGIILTDIVSKQGFQPDLFTQVSNTDSHAVMTLVDDINRIFGRDTIVLASQGLTKPWLMQRNHLSKVQLHQWHHLPPVSC